MDRSIAPPRLLLADVSSPLLSSPLSRAHMRLVPFTASCRHVVRVALVLCASAERDANLQLYDTPYDGDCLFSAVALSAAITDRHPPQARARAVRTAAASLRARAMDVLCPNGVPDENIVVGGLPAPLLVEPMGGEGGKGYCERMRTSGEWGSTAEVVALTRVLGRPIRVHTAFGVEEYGNDLPEASAAALAIHFADNHYRAATEKPSAKAATEKLRGGASSGEAEASSAPEACAADEAAVGDVLDRLHAAAAAADSLSYFGLFGEGAVFMGTDDSERWDLETFRRYAGARFDAGDGWLYVVRDRHVRVSGRVAWFDESLTNAKLGACRGSGVLTRDDDAAEWRIAQYNLAMTIPNERALEVAKLVAGSDKAEA